MACGYATELSPAQVRSKEPAEAQRQVLRYAISRRLTVKLRGRLMSQAALRSNEALRACLMRPSRRLGRTIFPGARGAKQTTHHGPLERLLEVTQPGKTV